MSSIKNYIADYFGLRVATPHGLQNQDELVEAHVAVPELSNEHGTTIHANTKVLHVRVYIISDEATADESEPKTQVSTAYLVERVARVSFQVFTVLASTTIALLGFASIINPLSPVFATISIICTIISIILFATSWYFDWKFEKEKTETGVQAIVKPSKEDFAKFTDALEAGKKNRLEKHWKEGKLYIPKLDLENHRAEENAARWTLTTVFSAVKKNATDAYTTVYSSIRSADADNKTTKVGDVFHKSSSNGSNTLKNDDIEVAVV